MTRYLSSLPLALLVLASAACVPRAVPPAPVAPPPPAPVAPSPAPAPTPVADWQDWPWTPGAWRYVRDATGTHASYGVTRQAPAAELRCDRAARAVLLSRPGSNPAPFTIRTSAATRSVPTQVVAAAVPQVVARFAIDDRLLDAMAFTRGRFTVEQADSTPLVLPPWAEVGRVIEDCRG
ncbi:hypothetical protein QP166_09755 [Sphingomonas sp. LR60]|uniref:hypothetical protein n=1 Tax=Sphingomonas sp. LR60 TaxID=3050233 RepID=UPI002FE189FB